MDVRNAIMKMYACGPPYTVNNRRIKIKGKEKNKFTDIDDIFNMNNHWKQSNLLKDPIYEHRQNWKLLPPTHWFNGPMYKDDSCLNWRLLVKMNAWTTVLCCLHLFLKQKRKWKTPIYMLFRAILNQIGTTDRCMSQL